jgi:FtsH-binding integral membrane protein
MNRWVEANIDANPDWKRMLKGNPIRSTYLWMAIILSVWAFLGVAKMASQIYGHHQQVIQWAPILVAILLLMVMTGNGAIRAIGDARLDAATGKCSETVERRAFQKFRTYSLFAGISGMALILLTLYI